MPLVAERLTRNVATLRNSAINVLIESWYVVRKLHGDTCNELAGVANISPASREEEAGPETTLFKVSSSHSASNRGLSRACQAIQPEYTPLILSISPIKYLLKNIDARVRKASRLVLPGVRIKGRFCSER